MTFPDHGLVLDQPYVSVSRKVASRQSRSSWSRSALRSNSTPERGFLRCSRSPWRPVRPLLDVWAGQGQALRIRHTLAELAGTEDGNLKSKFCHNSSSLTFWRTLATLPSNLNNFLATLFDPEIFLRSVSRELLSFIKFGVARVDALVGSEAALCLSSRNRQIDLALCEGRFGNVLALVRWRLWMAFVTYEPGFFLSLEQCPSRPRS